MSAVRFFLISLLVFSVQAVKADTIDYDATGVFNPSYFKYKQNITFIELNECESKSLNSYAKELFFENSKNGYFNYNSASVEGLSLYSKKNDSCVVFYKRPKTLIGRDMAVLGHEVAHCIYGAYHSSKFFEERGVSVKDIEKDTDQDLAINLFVQVLLDSCEANNDENKNNMLRELLN